METAAAARTAAVVQMAVEMALVTVAAVGLAELAAAMEVGMVDSGTPAAVEEGWEVLEARAAGKVVMVALVAASARARMLAHALDSRRAAREAAETASRKRPSAE